MRRRHLRSHPALRGVWLALALLMTSAGPAFAQTVDHPSCAPWKAKWSEASRGSDLTAIDDVIGKIPPLCPNLKAEAAAGRAVAAKRIELEHAEAAKKAEQARAAEARQQAAIEAARRANDPCLQARNDWGYMQTASEAAVRAYRNALPSACAAWRAQADERLTMFDQQRAAAAAEVERQRIAAQQAAERQRTEAARIQQVAAAARATGIEGRWAEVGRLEEKCEGRPTETFVVDGEYLANTFAPNGSTYRFRISRWTANEVWTANDAGGKGQQHHVISGNVLRINGSATPDIVHMYIRC